MGRQGAPKATYNCLTEVITPTSRVIGPQVFSKGTVTQIMIFWWKNTYFPQQKYTCSIRSKIISEVWHATTCCGVFWAWIPRMRLKKPTSFFGGTPPKFDKAPEKWCLENYVPFGYWDSGFSLWGNGSDPAMLDGWMKVFQNLEQGKTTKKKETKSGKVWTCFSSGLKCSTCFFPGSLKPMSLAVHHWSWSQKRDRSSEQISHVRISKEFQDDLVTSTGK